MEDRQLRPDLGQVLHIEPDDHVVSRSSWRLQTARPGRPQCALWETVWSLAPEKYKTSTLEQSLNWIQSEPPGGGGGGL